MAVQPYSATAPIKSLAGTAANPGVTFTGDADSGLFSPGANQVGITTGGTQRLLIGADGTITLANSISVPLASAAAPSIYFGTDTDTGLYSPGANQLAISTNGTGRLFVDSSGDVSLPRASGGYMFQTGGSIRAGIRSNDNNELLFNRGTDITEMVLTANGVGIGTTSPSRQLEVSANAAQIAIVSDNDTTSELLFGDSADDNVGRLYYNHSDNSLGFWTNAGERARITSDGKLGLGTSSPSAPAHIVATDGSTNSINIGLIVDYEATGAEQAGAGTAILFRGKSGGGGTANYNQAMIASNTLGANNAHGLSFYTKLSAAGALQERVRIDYFGRVGIGTVSPATPLDVNGDVAITDKIIHRSDTDTAIRFPAADTFAIETAGSERARIDSSGRLLVGTSTARSNFYYSTTARTPGLQYESSGSDTSLSVLRTDGLAALYLANAGTVVNGDGIGGLNFVGNDGTNLRSFAKIEAEADGAVSTADVPGRLVFSVTPSGSASPTEAMRINNAGELLVGYTSDNGAYKLQVNSQIFATSATIATSDGRYKENVAPLNGSLDLVKALRPVSFTWKQQENITRLDDEGNEVLVREGHNFPKGTQVGFIAQEVQEVLDGKPWLGSVIKENVRPAVKDNDGNELAPEEQFYGIAEGNLIAVLTNALQEATAKIEDLEARLTAAGL